MPDLDGFELAAMIREHPRFQQDRDHLHFRHPSAAMSTGLRGYEMGAVDYVPVPVIPEVLRAKVKIFAELYRKSRQLEQLNAELERRVADAPRSSNARPRGCQESEDAPQSRAAAGQMGSWDWDLVRRRLRLGRGTEADFRCRREIASW